MKSFSIFRWAASLVVLGSSFLATASPVDVTTDPGLGTADFRYALPWWQTAICLPDDPDKTLVGKDGQLLFDFGGGGIRNFGLCVQADLVQGTRWMRQETLSPRAPIVQTWKAAGGLELLEETFIVTPKLGEPSVIPFLTRSDGSERLAGWGKPARPCASAFTGVDVGFASKVLRFHASVPGHRQVTVVFGLCESWHRESGKRPLILSVEGGSAKTVDPVKDFGADQPGLYSLPGQDKDGNGTIDVSVSTPEGAEDRNPILNALWIFDSPPANERIISGEADGQALALWPTHAGPVRQAVMLLTLRNTSASNATAQPVLSLHSVAPVTFSLPEHAVYAGAATRLSVSQAIESCLAAASNRFELRLSPVTLGPGGICQIAVTLDRRLAQPRPALSVNEALALLQTAREWWEKGSLPFDTIQIPDPGIQAMIESSVRNIWQAREIKQGQPAFHVGPTVYRGLWVVDGSFLLESAALLGRGQDARAGVEYLLSHQKPDGSFELISHFWKENGIVLWAATRHAFLTQDKTWLRSHWPVLQRVVKAIQNLRAQASKDPASLCYRLLPPGDIDGGISNRDKPEYSNVYWCLAGLKAAISAAHWIDDQESANAWQKEFDDFYATFRQAATRDVLKDSFGNAYLPTMMANADNHVPARGQWAFCHAVYPGQVFPPEDTFVEGQLAMLRATKVQGMVFDTGWMKAGIWNYFASFYGHAELWQGRGRQAARVLYDFARHAAPTRVWREEQKPVGKGGDEVGDMPHNWASAEFIRLTTHLLQLDRGNELHLLEGFPAEWAGPGMVTRLNGVLTPFGPLYLTVTADATGQRATLEFRPLARNCEAVVVHLPDGSPRRLAATERGSLTFDLKPAPRINHARPYESQVPAALLPLPPGAVEPAGWLRDWAQAARQGITGHLDEWHPTFADGWKGVPIKAPGAARDGTGWPIEQSAYWLDGALRLGFVLHDQALIQKIRARLDPVVEGINRAGYGTSFIYWKPDAKPAGFDSWAHSQMGRALVALYQATGDQRVLNALVKAYADYPVPMGQLGFSDVTGLCNLDAMLETYSLSGDRCVFERALQAISQPSVEQELQSWLKGRLDPGHMVITYENIRLPALAYPWSGDRNQLQATLKALQWLDQNHMLPYGVASGEEYASGIGAFRKTETCDVTAMLLTTSWMYRILGNGEWGDRMERAFFNAGAAPVARDFQTMCYYQSPNRLRSDSLPCEQPHSPGPEGVRFHPLGCSNVLCCVGALNRILPNYIIHMWMATRDNGLAAALYGPATVNALVGARVPVTITTTTDYPFNETLSLRIDPTETVEFPLYLRIPAWCSAPRIHVNGEAVEAGINDHGFARITRAWNRGDQVKLELPMAPKVITGYETEFPAANREYFRFEPGSLFESRRLPYASVCYGPLLFSLAIPDVDPNTPAPEANWQFALDTDSALPTSGITVERTPVPARFDWSLDAPLALNIPAQNFAWRPTDAQALPAKPVTGTAAVTLRLVPYGCTKFRISMFPVTERAWRSPTTP